jgi:hypothetical protein
MTTKMTFGKFKDRPIIDVELGYLIWCRDNLASCPVYILDELLRRGKCSVSKKKQTKEQQRKPARLERKARRQRAKAAKKLEVLRRGVLILNPGFDRLRVEYVKAGGDLSACPFDAKDVSGQVATEQRLLTGA